MAKLSSTRKATYYIGMGIMVIGFILFMSVFLGVAGFISGTMGIGNGPNRFPPFSNAFFGMFLIIVGSIISNIGAKGAAGSGLILDPEKAREDLKPFNEAKGEMINDVIQNIDVVEEITKHHEEKEIIKIRCRSCGILNDEDAKFCKSCGKEI